MKFKTVAEAFNHYRNTSIADLEKRASEINAQIDSDANADIEALNIELRGIKEARENAELRGTSQQLNPITGMNTQQITGNNAAEVDVYGTTEYRSAFYKTLIGKPLTAAESKAFNTGVEEYNKRAAVSSNAAAVLPTSTLNEIIKKARTIGGLMGECRAFNMPTKIAIPVGTPSTRASWHTEGAAVTPDDNIPVNVMFDGFEIIKMFSMSVKVKTMSIASFEAYLVDELIACVMECLADGLINGGGSTAGEGTGLITGITWNTTNTVTAAKTGFTYNDVVQTVAKLKRGYSKGAKWCMNNTMLYTVFYGMVDSNGRPLFISDPKSEDVGKILGFEVVVDDNMPADVAIFGNFKYMGYNLPESIAVESSTHSSFNKGMIDYRALAIADCKPIVAEAFVKLNKAAQ